ncbi:glycoside hydrolase family 2 protein [Propionibacteriaceae bacterium Y1685]
MTEIPKPEYPRPQMVRPDWLNLNGMWQFEIDQADTGLERGLLDRELTDEILVPYAPESKASGVENTDFLQAVWYRREISFPDEWAGREVLLHFGAVDQDATVWADGVELVRHRGGFSPFTARLGDVGGTTVTIVVRARDLKDQLRAGGKQATWYGNTHCFYTRTTGIWQTVWAEPVAAVHVGRPRITPNVGGSFFDVELPLSSNAPGHTVTAVLWDGKDEIATASAATDLDKAANLRLVVPQDRVRLWEPGKGELYDITVTVADADGTVIDEVGTYAGLRSVTIDGRKFLVNGKPFFQRLVLDQGYWPDTLMTAPDEAAIIADIELSLAAGFNSARLHQKVFEERFLYHADRLGYPVWGEFGDWGVSGQGTRGHNQAPQASFVTEWLEVLERDYSHPSIIGWCPLNETHQELHDRITVLDDITRGMFLATKAADRTRPVLDSSGYSHRVLETEVWDSHLYEQDPARFAELVGGLAAGTPYENKGSEDATISQPYAGQPYFVSEFGGIWWNPDAQQVSGNDQAISWGYGQRVQNEEEFHVRAEGLIKVLLDDPEMFGYCWTQLTDVFQEENGVYRFDRSTKFDVDRFRAAQQRPAAYEQS